MIEFGYGKSPPSITGTAVSCSDINETLVGIHDIRNNGNGQDSGNMLSELSELSNKFQPKKSDAILLSESYKRLGYFDKSQRVYNCGSFLSFRHEIYDDGSISDSGQLYRANFCRDRLCPVCSWRRSLKIFGQVSQCVDVMQKEYKFLFLTLTVRNCLPSDLSKCVSELFYSWGKLRHLKRFKKSILGYFRVLEITRNNSNGTYHPHFHVILVVSNSYSPFSDCYIPHSEWLNMWQSCCNDFSISQVNIKFCKVNKDGKYASSIAEVAKYSVKSSDFLNNDYNITDNIVFDYYNALSGHRLAQFGGVFRKVHHDLQLDDYESGDLINVSDKLNPLVNYLICHYKWSSGVYKIIGADLVNGGV